MQEQIKYSHNDQYTLIEMFLDRSDYYKMSDISRDILKELEKQDFPNLIIDINNIRYMNSSVVGFLIELMHIIKKHDSELILVCEIQIIMHILKMLNVPNIIKIFSNRNEAHDYFKNLEK